MHTAEAQVTEIGVRDGSRVAWLACPPGVIPGPGQYALAYDPAETAAALGVTVFHGAAGPQGFLALPTVPVSWEPGMLLRLRGPLGHGFRPWGNLRRLALAALGDSVARLQPLIQAALAAKTDLVLCTQAPYTSPSPALEIYPLAALPEVVPWADVLALDLPLEELPHLRRRLGLEERQPLPCPAQALVYTPMPCAALAECGACAVPARRGWKLACADGPVFDLNDLTW